MASRLAESASCMCKVKQISWREEKVEKKVGVWEGDWEEKESFVWVLPGFCSVEKPRPGAPSRNFSSLLDKEGFQ